MADVGTAAPPWRHYTIKSPVGACRIEYDDLKRLFDFIDEKQREEGKSAIATLAKQPNETDDAFDQRRERVRDAFKTSVTLTAPDGEMVTGNSRDFLDSAAVPERIQSMLIDTSMRPRAVLSITPNNWLNLFLDFSRPSLIDSGALPSAPTPNQSNYTIVAVSEPWATALNARLRNFFVERKTSVGWPHTRGAYDVVLMFFGLPLALWGTYRIGPLVTLPSMPGAIITGIYVYVFFFVLNLFRIFFSYTRWVFPLVELQTPRATRPQQHRLFWGGIIIAVIGGFLFDLIKSLAIG